MKKSTHFGFQEVPVEEKVRRVADVFHSVASKYDVMNDLMSFGIHRAWKKFTIAMSGVREGHRVLDLAGGTGDLALQFSKKVGDEGQVVLSDINASMLAGGRARLLDHGILGNVDYVQANAEVLPFQNNYFDCVTIAFGLRNVTNQNAALASIYRVLKPGGRLLVLEFSKPNSTLLSKAYDFYSFNVIPKVGEWVTGDKASYQYLVESIRKHPDQETLKTMMDQVGYARTDYFNLSGGIVALHRGYKF